MSSNRHKLLSDGFTLIEVLLVVIIMGIIATAMISSSSSIIDTARTEATKQEMLTLAEAIIGNPKLHNAGTRTNFGYVGDVGALPSSLGDLVTNPGSYTTWNGPYISNDLLQIPDDYLKDAWGSNYSFSGGVEIISNGSGSNMVVKLANATDDLLYNNLSGNILDIDGTPPGAIYDDSVRVRITSPNGTGSTTTESINTNASGYFEFDSLPIGNLDIQIIYVPNDDTMRRFISLIPNSSVHAEYRLSSNLWYDTTVSGGGSGVETLRPNGAGSITHLTRFLSPTNWQCVDEVSSDGNGTFVARFSNSYSTDVYAIEDPSDTGSSINSVVVYCRTKRFWNQGMVRPTIYIGSTEYNGTEQSMTTSYANYSYTWATNPATSAAWTWTEIINLQAGVRIKGQNWISPAICTQVWVEVTYGQ